MSSILFFNFSALSNFCEEVVEEAEDEEEDEDSSRRRCTERFGAGGFGAGAFGSGCVPWAVPDGGGRKNFFPATGGAGLDGAFGAGCVPWAPNGGRRENLFTRRGGAGLDMGDARGIDVARRFIESRCVGCVDQRICIMRTRNTMIERHDWTTRTCRIPPFLPLKH